MTDDPKLLEKQGQGAREPILNLPGAVLALCTAMVAIHLARTFVLNEDGQLNLLVWFAFVPLRLIEPTGQFWQYMLPPSMLSPGETFGGLWPLLWTSVTHAFLHGGWEHLIFNTLWLAIFGTPVVRRYGPIALFALFGISAVAGAVLYAAYVVAFPQLGYLVGASGGIAGLTGAAVRFMFQPVIVGRHPETGEPVALGRKLASLRDVFANPQSRFFVLVWVVLNAVIPLLPIGNMQIAWHAHLGGFFTGLLLVPLFERRA